MKKYYSFLALMAMFMAVQSPVSGQVYTVSTDLYGVKTKTAELPYSFTVSVSGVIGSLTSLASSESTVAVNDLGNGSINVTVNAPCSNVVVNYSYSGGSGSCTVSCSQTQTVPISSGAVYPAGTVVDFGTGVYLTTTELQDWSSHRVICSGYSEVSFIYDDQYDDYYMVLSNGFYRYVGYPTPTESNQLYFNTSALPTFVRVLSGDGTEGNPYFLCAQYSTDCGPQSYTLSNIPDGWTVTANGTAVPVSEGSATIEENASVILTPDNPSENTRVTLEDVQGSDHIILLLGD